MGMKIGVSKWYYIWLILALNEPFMNELEKKDQFDISKEKTVILVYPKDIFQRPILLKFSFFLKYDFFHLLRLAA